MTLSWYGLSSFKIVTSGGNVTLVTDPFAKSTGLTSPRGAADIVLISRDQDPYNYVDGLTGTPLIIKNPGEFDIKGVHIRGIYDDIDPENPNTIYYLEIDGITIGFLGVFKGKELSEKQLEELDGVDVLIVPVGGKDKVANWETASHVVQQIEPKFIVPSFFAQSGLSFDLDNIDKFLKDMGGQARKEDKLTLKAKDVLTENVEVVQLSPQR